MDLNEGYVIGLLADLEPKIPRLLGELEAGQKRAAAVDAELSALLRRLDASRQGQRDAKLRAEKLNISIGEKNQRTASLHQEIATLKKRSDDYKAEMERAEPGDLQRRLRRERAKLSVQAEDRQQEVESLKTEIEGLRKDAEQAEAKAVEERERVQAVGAELDRLQVQLPRPSLFAELSLATLARGHCELFLEKDLGRWQAETRRALGYIETLHGELRAGKYRLDKNSELVGGRSAATAEAVYAAVALGDTERAKNLFVTATDPGLYFHQIFNVFRVWCLGLYLSGRRADLEQLLLLHQYSEGLRGAYVQVFAGLVRKDGRAVANGLRDITRHEWELWSDPAGERGAGVVNLGAVALGRLALERGIAVQLPGPTVPDLLIAGGERKRAAAR